MSARARAVFMLVAPESDPQQHQLDLETPVVSLRIVAVASYNEAEQVARECVEQGYSGIELCAGFGAEGVARVAAAVGPDIPVGVVRFDHHPLLAYNCGDRLFA